MKFLLLVLYISISSVCFAQIKTLKKISGHVDDALKATIKHGDDISKMIISHSDDATKFLTHGEDISKLMVIHSDDFSRLGLHADDVVKLGIREGDDILHNFSSVHKSQDFINHKIKKTPIGNWSGMRGNSIYNIDLSSIPKRANSPSNPKTYRQLLEIEKNKPLDLPNLEIDRKIKFKKGIEELINGKGVKYSSGEPDFSNVSLFTVDIPQVTQRYGPNGTMANADKNLSKILGITPEEVREWINSNQFVWHELGDGTHAQLVPHAIHSNLDHSGAIAYNKYLKKIGAISE